jgi:hypothetical protein
MDNVGIDKILLTTKEFGVKNLSNTDIFGRNVSIKQGGGELPIYRDIEGTPIQANSFYHNGQKAIYDISTKGLAIAFNPSKDLHPYNLISTGKELNNRIEDIKTELKSIGILTDINAMKLSRFDLAKNQPMDFPLPMYNEGLKFLKGKRSDSRSAPDGYYVGNKSHETIFYNKGKELKFRKVEAITPENFLRVEPRFRNTDSVKRYTTIQSVYDLTNIDSSDIETMYKTYLKNVIFSRSKFGSQILIDFDNEIKFYNSIKSKMPKGYFNYWLQINSIDSLLNMFGSVENVKRFLTDAGENRMTIHRNLSKVKELIATRGILSSTRKEVTPISLLNEIREKFVA